MEEPKSIDKLKIKYKGTTYDKINWFSIDSYDNKAHFTSTQNDDMAINVNCDLKDLEILIDKE